ncbi:MAG: hypothetical protein ACM3JJ_08075, partial [Hyphomicrobiales bacterium]
GAQTDAEQAARLAFYEMAGLGYQYADRYPDVIRKVTVADVTAALRKYLKPDAYTRVAVGKEPEKAAGSSSKPSR